MAARLTQTPETLLRKLPGMLAEGKEHGFYCGGLWLRTREAVLKMDKYECQSCKARGRYSRADVVHHVQHLRDRPDLALSMWDGERRQLVSLCKACHEAAHPESMKQNAKIFEPVTAERWD